MEQIDKYHLEHLKGLRDRKNEEWKHLTDAYNSMISIQRFDEYYPPIINMIWGEIEARRSEVHSLEEEIQKFKT
jgi:hypothetical protein